MLRNDQTKGASIKEMRKREKERAENELKIMCENLAIEKITKEELVKMSNANKGLWYLPVKNEEDTAIELLAIMKPIDRYILSYASTKIEDEGMYLFLEAAMRECLLACINADGSVVIGNDKPTDIIDVEEYFLPSATKFNKIIEGKKAALLKR
jgi:hypothetical protein